MAGNHDLAEHTAALLSIISVLATLGAFLFWRLISDIRDKVKSLADLQTEFMKTCFQNHAAMIEKFPTRTEWTDWQKGRETIIKGQDELWEAINNHTHNGGGRVVR